MAKQVLLLHNILFDRVSPASSNQDAPKYLLCTRELGSAVGWREQVAPGTGIPPAVSSLLPAPGSLQGQFATRS